MRILVGSQAAKNWYPDFREPKDIDYFTQDKIPGAESFWHPALGSYDWSLGYQITTASSDELYTIKVSHAFWANRWQKHMNDILFFQSKDCKIVPKLYDILYPIWEEHYGKKPARLNVPAEKFFNPKIDRKYDHDSLHASISYHDEPLYKAILRDGADVMVDKTKFDLLSYEDKCRLVREEVYATALERFLIPVNFKRSQRSAYKEAMFKTVTSFSKGWFPYFIVTNFTQLHEPDVDYVARHLDNKDKLITL